MSLYGIIRLQWVKIMYNRIINAIQCDRVQLNMFMQSPRNPGVFSNPAFMMFLYKIDIVNKSWICYLKRVYCLGEILKYILMEPRRPSFAEIHS